MNIDDGSWYAWTAEGPTADIHAEGAAHWRRVEYGFLVCYVDPSPGDLYRYQVWWSGTLLAEGRATTCARARLLAVEGADRAQWRVKEHVRTLDVRGAA